MAKSEDRYRKILSKFTREELIDLLVNLALRDKTLGQELEFAASRSDPKLAVKHARALIQSYLKPYNYQKAPIPSRHIPRACQGAQLVLEQAEAAAENGEYLLAAELYLCVIQEVLPVIQYGDYSDGEIGSLVEDALDGLTRLSEAELPAAVAEQLSNAMLQEAKQPDYHDQTYMRLDLLTGSVRLAKTAEQRQELDQYFTQIVNPQSGSETELDLAAGAASLQHGLILQAAGPEKATEYVHNHLHFPKLREIAIQAALDRQDYQLAETLCRQGEAANGQYYDNGTRWREYLYQVYEQSARLDEQRRLARDLILEGEFDYYAKLKATFPAEDWPKVYPMLLRAIEKPKHYRAKRVYPLILVAEGELAKLMEYVREEPERIEENYSYLLERYPEEVREVFMEHIINTARQVSKRYEHYRVTSLIHKFGEAFGKDQAAKAVRTVILTFPNRTALQDELKKLEL